MPAMPAGSSRKNQKEPGFPGSPNFLIGDLRRDKYVGGFEQWINQGSFPRR
jgi:hypothetical protein